MSAPTVLCGICNSQPELVVARFIQGLGGAMMVPFLRIIIFRSVPRSEFVAAISYLSVPGLLGPVIGPPLARIYYDLFVHLSQRQATRVAYRPLHHPQQRKQSTLLMDRHCRFNS